MAHEKGSAGSFPSEEVEKVIEGLVVSHDYTPEELLHIHSKDASDAERAKVQRAFRSALILVYTSPSPQSYEALGRVVKACSVVAMRGLALERLAKRRHA